MWGTCGRRKLTYGMGGIRSFSMDFDLIFVLDGFRLLLIRLIINFPLWLLNENATNDNVPDSGNLNTRGGDSKPPWRPNPAETAV